jgi:fumarate reductase flavoprotein subunit
VGSRGDAIRIGGRLGADTACLDAYQGHGSVTTPQSTLLTWATIMHGGIMVNGCGDRFGDESSGYSEFAEQVLSQPGGVAWAVFDERIDRLCRTFADYQRCLESNAIRWSEDVPTLAETIGAPEGALRDTLERAGELPDPFGRSHWEQRLRPPYAVAKVTGALFHTQGGLRVDGSARVLRHGSPIPGLYAAGGAAVGLSGHGAAGYLAGNGLLAALGLGYVAGRACGGSSRRTSVTSVTT